MSFYSIKVSSCFPRGYDSPSSPEEMEELKLGYSPVGYSPARSSFQSRNLLVVDTETMHSKQEEILSKMFEKTKYPQTLYFLLSRLEKRIYRRDYLDRIISYAKIADNLPQSVFSSKICVIVSKAYMSRYYIDFKEMRDLERSSYFQVKAKNIYN